jgi:1-acyl-sn-glycerol-3-phosphate acyltransferase
MPSDSTVVTSNPGQEREITSRISPLLMGLAYTLFRYLVLPIYFRDVHISGQAHLPHQGAIMLAPTHRSRWDALLVTYAAGRLATGRDLRFMVSIDEMQGLQGWFIERLGGFPVNPGESDIGSLHHSMKLLAQQRMLVIFPEGDIHRAAENVATIHSGPAYIGLRAMAENPGLKPQIIPMSIRYSPPVPSWRSRADIKIGPPLAVADYGPQPTKGHIQRLRDDLQAALQDLHGSH